MANIETDIFAPTPTPKTLETSPADYAAALVVFNIGAAATAYGMFMDRYVDGAKEEDRNVFANGTLLHIGDEVVTVELETGENTAWERDERRVERLYATDTEGRPKVARLTHWARGILFQGPHEMPKNFYDIEETLTGRIAQFFVFPRAVVQLEYRKAELYDDMATILEPSSAPISAKQA